VEDKSKIPLSFNGMIVLEAGVRLAGKLFTVLELLALVALVALITLDCQLLPSYTLSVGGLVEVSSQVVPATGLLGAVEPICEALRIELDAGSLFKNA
jgi:hypothetical protein